MKPNTIKLYIKYANELEIRHLCNLWLKCDKDDKFQSPENIQLVNKFTQMKLSSLLDTYYNNILEMYNNGEYIYIASKLGVENANLIKLFIESYKDDKDAMFFLCWIWLDKDENDLSPTLLDIKEIQKMVDNKNYGSTSPVTVTALL